MYVQSGKRMVVDVDLAKFIDRGNYDMCVDRLRRRIRGEAVMRFIRAHLSAGIWAPRYLSAGIMDALGVHAMQLHE
ncbi:MAG: hypothetical protein JO006_09160 [Paucibacter sp.]|nr:hypothetical protein [Roseateles sp.]